MTQRASLLVQLGIPALAVGVAVFFVLLAARSVRALPQGSAERRLPSRAAAGVLAMFAVSGAAAASGVLADFSRRPPPFMLLVAGLAATVVWTTRTALGRRIATGLPLWVLVGTQGFRLPLELVMHRAADDGVMPGVMSYTGYNFDIVTGITALLLGAALYMGRAPLGLVLAWNVLGTTLLAVVVGVAIAASPLFLAFGEAQRNVWVTEVPYVWLPAILVQFALFGHLTVFARLRAERAEATLAPPAPGGTPARA